MRLAMRYSKLIVAACLALLAAGCTGSNLLDTGNTLLEFEFEIVGTENTVLDIACANIMVSTIETRPLDGVCMAPATNAGDRCLGSVDCVGGPCEGGTADAVGVTEIKITPGNPNVFANMLGPACELPGGEAQAFEPPRPITLSEGLYEISVLLAEFKLFQESPPEFLECIGAVNLTFGFGDDLRFLVPSGGGKTLRFRLDLAELEAILSDNTACGMILILGPDFLECLNCDGAP